MTAIDEIREKIAGKISGLSAKAYITDQILSIPITVKEGRVCPWCTKGRVTVMKLKSDEVYEDDCPTCHGTGKQPLTRTLLEWSKLGVREYLEGNNG